MAAVTVQSAAVKSGIRLEHRVPGMVICRTGDYTETVARDANSVVEMVPVPKGAQILDIQLYISDAGASRTADVGDGGSAQRYFAALAVNTGPLRKSLKVDGVATYIANYKYAEDDTIDVKWLVDTLEVGQKIHMEVYYKMADTVADET